MKTPNPAFRAVLTALAVALAGCAPAPALAPAPVGAGTDTPAAAAATPAMPARPRANVSFFFKAPQRRLQALSGATAKVAVTVGDDDPVEATMTASGAQIDVSAPVGEDVVFEVESFDASDRRLARGSAIADIVEATENTVTVTLGGIPASIELAASDDTPDIPPADEQATGTITVSARDAAGAVIIGNYDEAVTVAIDGASGKFALADTVATNSDTHATYTYTNTGGLDDTTAVDILATASGATDGTLTLTPRVEPTSIAITSGETPAGLVGDTLNLVAQVHYSNGATSTATTGYTVASSAAGVVSNDLDALGVGDATLTVTATGAVDTGETVSDAVTARIFDFTVSPGATATAPMVGDAVPLTCDIDAPASSTGADEAWSLAATSDATLTDAVGPEATLEASAAGTYDLTYTYTDDDGYSIAQDFQVTVLEPLFGDAGTQTLQLLSLDDVRTFDVNGAYAGAVTPVSSAPAVATVAYAAGVLTVTPVAVGATTITATAADGRVATFTVTVTTSTLDIE